MFQAEISSRKKSIVTQIYVTQARGIKSLLSKYSAFDLGILQINADELCNTLDQPKKIVPDIKHLEYPQIAKHLLLGEALAKKYDSLKAEKNSPHQVEEMKQIFSDRFKGIGCHK